jgi:hypothetical protein
MPRLYPKGSLMVEDPQTGRDVPAGLPAEDTVKESHVRIVLDGQKIRHDEEGSIWDLSYRRFCPYNESVTFVNGVSRRLCGSQGNAQVSRENMTTSMLALSPVCLAYRLFDPVLGKAKPEEMRFVGYAEHDGHRCVVVCQPRRQQGYEDRFWFAIDQDYSVVAWDLSGPDGTAIYSAGMKYEKGQDGHWRLRSWETAGPEGGGVRTCKVLSLRLNEPVEANAFDLVFPRGTRVTDAIAGIEYRVGDDIEGAMERMRKSVVESGDGAPSTREATGNAAARESAKAREPSEPAAVSQTSIGDTWWIAALAAACVLVVGGVFVLWRRRRTPGGDPRGQE